MAKSMRALLASALRGAAATACAAAVSATALAASMPECEVGAAEWTSAQCAGADVKAVLTDREIAAGAEFGAPTSTVNVVFAKPVDISSVRVVTFGDSEANRFIVSSKGDGQQAFSNCVPRAYAVADHIAHSIDIEAKDVAELQIGIAPYATLPVVSELQIFESEGGDASTEAVVERIRDVAVKQGIVRLYAEAGLATRVASASKGAVTAEGGPAVSIDEQTGFFATAKNAAAVRDVFKFRKFAMREIAVGDAGIVFIPESNQPYPLPRETGISFVGETFVGTMPEEWIAEEIAMGERTRGECLALLKRKPHSPRALLSLISTISPEERAWGMSLLKLIDDATKPSIKYDADLGGGIHLIGVSIVEGGNGISPGCVVRVRYYLRADGADSTAKITSTILGNGVDLRDVFTASPKCIDNLFSNRIDNYPPWMVERRMAILNTATPGICKMELTVDFGGEKSQKVVIDPAFIVQ